MAPTYFIEDYGCYSYYDFEMTNHYRLKRFEVKNSVFQFTRKYLLGDYNNFIELKNQSLDFKNPLFKLFKRQKCFAQDSYQHEGLYFFLDHLIPLLTYYAKHKQSFYQHQHDLIETYLKEKNPKCITETMYNIIQDVYSSYISEVGVVIKSDPRYVMADKVSNF